LGQGCGVGSWQAGLIGPTCPNCPAVNVAGPELWAKIRCNDCGIELETVCIDPLDVDLADDWQDDDY
jgi:lysine biosynthesis protein LysW